MNKLMIYVFALALTFQACAQTAKNEPMDDYKGEKVIKTEEEWRTELTPEEYRILREKGTERAFTGDLYQHKEDGTYICAACAAPLFDSETKYESGSGWPSFYEPINQTIVGEITDASHGMIRTEVVCNRCGGHLGHVFSDGPQPTGLRYCINSASLDFKSKDNEEEE